MVWGASRDGVRPRDSGLRGGFGAKSLELAGKRVWGMSRPQDFVENDLG